MRRRQKRQFALIQERIVDQTARLRVVYEEIAKSGTSMFARFINSANQEIATLKEALKPKKHKKRLLPKREKVIKAKAKSRQRVKR